MSEFVCEVAPDEFGELTEVTNFGEEIVRCLDCGSCQYEFEFGGGRFWCVLLNRNTKPDCFCAWGEKR